MDFSTLVSSPLKARSPVLVAFVTSDDLDPVVQSIDEACGGAVRAVFGQDFKATNAECLVLRQLSGLAAARLMLVGLGARNTINGKTLAKALKAAAGQLQSLRVEQAVVVHDPATVGVTELAVGLARSLTESGYRYSATLSKKPDASVLKGAQLLVSKADRAVAELGLQRGQALGRGINFARELGDLPGNVCTPSYLAQQARALAKGQTTLKVEVLERRQIEALRMGSFLSVARGSDEPPRFIVLHYKGAKRAAGGRRKTASGPVVLVGKGITFDSGGISIKPAAAMDEMKYDMCGAASVLGVFRTLVDLQLPLEVVGLIPACENLPSGKANKPGDVVTSMSGQTIEILNTDAEGRLILCDALTYAERFKPSAVIDIATLTGACVTALGNVHAGLFSTHDELAQALLEAGQAAQDTAWRMPLDEEYQERLKSNFADMANIGGPAGGAVTAACFLARYAKAYPWAHLDIAGVAWSSAANKGATGRPVALLVEYLSRLQAA